MESLNEISLIGPCGMNCGICMAYLREQNKCPGCRIMDPNKAVSITRCKITNCEVIQQGKVTFCYECNDFPCKNLKHLDKRYRTRYNMSMIENLANIRDLGMGEFLRNEDARWTCPECGGRICVHKGLCMSCGRRK